MEQESQMKTFMSKNVIITTFLIIIIVGFYATVGQRKQNNKASAGESVACTMEAKICGDGSSVGRIGPKCEFSRCPDGLEAYSAQSYGFSFQYKDNYTVVTKDLGNAERAHHSITFINKDDYKNINSTSETPMSINIDIFQNLENQSVEVWIKGNNNSNFKLSKTQKLKVGVINNKQVYFYQWDGLYKGGSVVFAHNGNIVVSSVNYNSKSDQIKSDFIDLVQSIKFPQ